MTPVAASDGHEGSCVHDNGSLSMSSVGSRPDSGYTVRASGGLETSEVLLFDSCLAVWKIDLWKISE